MTEDYEGLARKYERGEYTPVKLGARNQARFDRARKQQGNSMFWMAFLGMLAANLVYEALKYIVAGIAQW